MKCTAAIVLATGLLANALPTGQTGEDVGAVEKRTFFPIMGGITQAKCAVSLLTSLETKRILIFSPGRRQASPSNYVLVQGTTAIKQLSTRVLASKLLPTRILVAKQWRSRVLLTKQRCPGLLFSFHTSNLWHPRLSSLLWEASYHNGTTNISTASH